MMASRLGREASGIGGGAPGVEVGSGLAADGRFEGTGGGEGALLLNPISSADRRGGGAITLLVRLSDVVEVCAVGLAGSAGLSGDLSRTFDCRGGRDGLAGSSV